MTPSETLRTLSGLDPNSTGGRAIQNTQRGMGDWGALLENTTNAASGLGSSSRLSSGAYERFLVQVMDMLRQSQQMGTASESQALEQNLNLQEEQLRRSGAPAIPGMRPSLQQQIRQQDVAAVEPSISGVQKRAQTFSEQLKNFGNTLDQSVALAGFLNQKAQTDKQEARDLVLNFPSAISKMDEKQAKELFSQAGIPWDLKDALSKKKEAPKTMETDQGIMQWDENTGTWKSTGYTKTKEKIPSQAEQQVAEYASRIEQAEPTITSLEKAIVDMNYLSYTKQIHSPSFLQNSTIQQYMQAARNLINAKLRRESGAVISPIEFAEARQQYLPQPGDSEETLKLKKNNRDLIFASLKKASGNAYSPLTDLLPGQSNTIRVRRKSDGQTGTIPMNEFDETLYEKL